MMHYRKIENLPNNFVRNSRTTKNHLQTLILDFYNSEDEYAEFILEDGEYSTSQSLYSGAKKAVQALKLPISVIMIRGRVYLRRDWEQ